MKKVGLFLKRFLIPIIIVAIFLSALFFRFYRLSDVPVSLYWDGAANVYNAYSILETGRDEYGIPFPLLFKSFNDYKMPANIYLTVIPIKLFGLNAFAERFNTAFFGSLTVLFTFFLIRELLLLQSLFKKESKFSFLTKSNFVISVSLLTAFFLSISPWHIQFSRAEFEANVGLFFVVLGAFLLLRFIRLKKAWSIYLSMAVFAVSMYFYRSILVFVPLLIFSFFVIFYKEILGQKRKVFLGLIIFVAIVLPFIPVITSKQGMIRSDQVSIQNNSFNELYKASLMQQKAGSTLISKIIYNRRLVLAKIFASNYLSHFSPIYLFITGDTNSGRHGPRGMGLLYLWELPFILFGLFLLFKLDRRVGLVILAWILIAPIPAAVSVPTPHALRTLNMLPMPQLATALGVVGIFSLLRSVLWKKIYVVFMAIIILVFFGLYLNNYYSYSANATSADWADGYKQLMQYILPRENNYNKIVITGHYWQPYIYALLYKKYDPRKFQTFGSHVAFDKYQFGGTAWESGQHELENVNIPAWTNSNNILVALSPIEYQNQKNNMHELTRIYNHNKDLVFIVGEIRKK